MVKKFFIPGPTLCPDCRMQRRLCFRNERKLYRRKCDFTGKSIVALYSPESSYKVYSQDVWWSDKWDPLSYGRDFDFSRPFFEQFDELWHQVPLVSLWVIQSENADYNNNCFNLKDCYLTINTDRCERTYYSYRSDSCADCMDCTAIYEAQLCYECIDCVKIYNCYFCKDVDNSNDCYFSTDLKGCKNCFGCHGLRNKENFIFNKQVTPEAWRNYFNFLHFTPSKIEEYGRQSRGIYLQVPKRPFHMLNCQNSSGEYLHDCKNVTESYDIAGGEDDRYCNYMPFETKDILDTYALASAELCYEVIGGGFDIYHSAFLLNSSYGPTYSYYCVQCVNGTKNCFGCVGLKKREYCILNKQYTKSEYERLVSKIIEHMKSIGEYGEFFPPKISPFGYNEVVANYNYPIKKEEARRRGWKWSDYEAEIKADKTILARRLPDSIADVPDDILNWAIVCEVSGKPFKIIPQELKFYRKLGLPIPRCHPDVRDVNRMNFRNPPQFFPRKCAKCQSDIQTTYAPERQETVYCEDCYLQEIY